MAEKIEVLEIDTGQSLKTLKQLKDEIKSLRSTLEGCEIGTDKFTSTLDELTAAQNELKNATKTTKQTLEGSYDALVAKMGELKRAWKATNDEIERVNIGEQIADINNQLKGMDASIGNHQRKVGDYKDDIVAAFNEMKSGTVSYGEAVADFNKQTEVTKGALEGIGNVASGVAGGFAAFQGVMALTGIESENFEKVMVKLNAAIAIAQGVSGMKGLFEGLGRIKGAFATAGTSATTMAVETTAAGTAMTGTAVATKSAEVAMKGFRKALIATGIGALVALLGTVISKIVDFVEKIKNAKEEQDEYNKAIEKQIEKEKERRDTVSDYVGTTISKFNLLRSEWTNLKTQQEQTDWIIDNADAFTELGLAITDVASAQEVLIKQAQKVINALTLQAEASALQEIYKESYKEAYKRAKQLDAQMATIVANPITAGYEVSGDERDKYNLGPGGIYTKKGNYFQHTTRQTYSRALGDYTTVTNWTDKLTAEGAAYVQGQRVEEVQSQIDVVYDEANAILEDVKQKQAEADAAAAEIASLLNKKRRSKGGGSGKGGGSSADDPAKQVAGIQERVRQSLIQGEKDELAELERIYLQEKKLLEDNGKDTAALTKEYEAKVADIKKKYREQDEQNNEIAREKLLESLNRNLMDVMYYEDQLMRKTEQKYLDKEIELDNATTSILPSLKEEDNIAPIQLEIDKTLELQAIRAAAFEAQMAQIKAVLDAEKEKDILTAEQEAQLQAQIAYLQNEKVQTVAESNSRIAALNKQLIRQQQEDNRRLAKNITDTFTSALNSASQILSQIQDGIDATQEEGFEKSKKLQIANATIQMLVGITSAISGAFTTKSGPWDIALAAIQAATIATTGGIQIAQIKKQKFSKEPEPVSVPSINTAALMSTPINYTTEVKGAQAIEDVVDTRVFVVESDITDTIRKVEVAEEESTF